MCRGNSNGYFLISCKLLIFMVNFSYHVSIMHILPFFKATRKFSYHLEREESVCWIKILDYFCAVQQQFKIKLCKSCIIFLRTLHPPCLSLDCIKAPGFLSLGKNWILKETTWTVPISLVYTFFFNLTAFISFQTIKFSQRKPEEGEGILPKEGMFSIIDTVPII